MRENEEAGAKYRTDIDANEACRFEIQRRIEDGMEQYKSAAFLKILSTFRLQAVRLQVRIRLVRELVYSTFHMTAELRTPGVPVPDGDPRSDHH